MSARLGTRRDAVDGHVEQLLGLHHLLRARVCVHASRMRQRLQAATTAPATRAQALQLRGARARACTRWLM
jgi:hypothetical protein